MNRKAWTREDVIVAYALYCITPLSQIRPSNKLIAQVAELSSRSLPSLVMRMQNFCHLDPIAKGKGKGGLGHVAKMDKDIYEEFKHDWGALSVLAEELTGLDLFDADPINGAKRLSVLTDKSQVTRERVFFRSAVMAAYEYRCCISGMTVPKLLVASHIKPYGKCNRQTERTNPENGLCLNMFYDRAYDQGLITVDPDLRIWVSNSILGDYTDEFTIQWLHNLQGESISLPERFRPAREFLEWHNDFIFKG